MKWVRRTARATSHWRMNLGEAYISRASTEEGTGHVLNTSHATSFSNVARIRLRVLRSPVCRAPSSSPRGPPLAFAIAWLKSSAARNPVPPARTWEKTQRLVANAR